MVVILRPEPEKNALAELFSTKELEFILQCVKTPRVLYSPAMDLPVEAHEGIISRVLQALRFRREQEKPETTVTGFWRKGHSIMWESVRIQPGCSRLAFTGRVATPDPDTAGALLPPGSVPVVTLEDAWDLFKTKMDMGFPGASLELFSEGCGGVVGLVKRGIAKAQGEDNSRSADHGEHDGRGGNIPLQAACKCGCGHVGGCSWQEPESPVKGCDCPACRRHSRKLL